MNYNNNRIIDEYIERVNKLLPYPEEIKKEPLAVLRSDVESAMSDTVEGVPSKAFGDPVDVAKNIVEGQEWNTNKAEWRTRFVAWIIDLFLKLTLGMLILSVGFFLLLLIMPFDELMEEFMKWETATTFGELINTQNALFTFIISFIFIIAIGTTAFFTYNIVLEYRYSTTIGKKLFNMIAVDHSGIKMVGRQAIIRNLSKIVLGEFLFIDMFLGLVLEKQTPERTEKQRGLDILAETIVIKVK